MVRGGGKRMLIGGGKRMLRGLIRGDQWVLRGFIGKVY